MSNTQNFDHNNAGREFELAEGDPQINQAAGGTAPKGLNAYEPTGPREPSGTMKINVKTKAGRDAMARALFTNKFASALFDKIASSLGCAVDQNAWPQTSDTASNRPKYDNETAPIPEQIGQQEAEAGARYKRYLRAAGSKKRLEKSVEKTAEMNLTDRISNLIAEGIESGREVGKGVHSTGSHTLGDTLKLKGLGHVPAAAKKAGGMGKALASKAGRLSLWHAAGKSAPSAAALGLYGGIAYKGLKKAYDKMGGTDYSQYYR